MKARTTVIGSKLIHTHPVLYFILSIKGNRSDHTCTLLSTLLDVSMRRLEKYKQNAYPATFLCPSIIKNLFERASIVPKNNMKSTFWSQTLLYLA